MTEVPSKVGVQEGDRCVTGSHDCSSNGTFVPLESSYVFVCVCNQGFEGDGRTCVGKFICVLLQNIKGYIL